MTGMGEIDKNPNFQLKISHKDEKHSIRNRVSNTAIMLYDDYAYHGKQ